MSCVHRSLERKNCLVHEQVDFLKSPLSCLFSTPKQRPLRGLTYSTLKFMRSTCGKSNERVKKNSIQA